MHKLSDARPIRIAVIVITGVVAANILALLAPLLLAISPASTLYWLLQFGVVGPLRFPLVRLGISPFDVGQQLAVWLSLGLLALLISQTRSAFLTGLLHGAISIISASSLYAVIRAFPPSDGALAISIALLMIVALSQVLIAALAGLAAVSRSYFAGCRRAACPSQFAQVRRVTQLPR